MPSKSLAAWGLGTIATYMGKVKAKYCQMTASHNASDMHMWYAIAITRLEGNMLLYLALLSYLTSLKMNEKLFFSP